MLLLVVMVFGLKMTSPEVTRNKSKHKLSSIVMLPTSILYLENVIILDANLLQNKVGIYNMNYMALLRAIRLEVKFIDKCRQGNTCTIYHGGINQIGKQCQGGEGNFHFIFYISQRLSISLSRNRKLKVEIKEIFKNSYQGFMARYLCKKKLQTIGWKLFFVNEKN